MRCPALFPILLLLSGCVFTARERTLVDEARQIGTRAVGDPLFAEVVLELAGSGAIDWSDSRGEFIPASGQLAPDQWLLQQFAAHGLFATDSIRAWAKWWVPWSSTTAATNACGPSVKLNVLRLRRTASSVANTLVHERVHSFCQIHANSQERPPNVCDAAYLYGDLAEMLARYRQTRESSIPREPLCPALCAALHRRGIVAECPAAVLISVIDSIVRPRHPSMDGMPSDQPARRGRSGAR